MPDGWPGWLTVPDLQGAVLQYVLLHGWRSQSRFAADVPRLLDGPQQLAPQAPHRAEQLHGQPGRLLPWHVTHRHL